MARHFGTEFPLGHQLDELWKRCKIPRGQCSVGGDADYFMEIPGSTKIAEELFEIFMAAAKKNTGTA